MTDSYSAKDSTDIKAKRKIFQMNGSLVHVSGAEEINTDKYAFLDEVGVPFVNGGIDAEHGREVSAVEGSRTVNFNKGIFTGTLGVTIRRTHREILESFVDEFMINKYGPNYISHKIVEFSEFPWTRKDNCYDVELGGNVVVSTSEKSLRR